MLKGDSSSNKAHQSIVCHLPMVPYELLHQSIICRVVVAHDGNGGVGHDSHKEEEAMADETLLGLVHV
jgi:hypothetical protein